MGGTGSGHRLQTHQPQQQDPEQPAPQAGLCHPSTRQGLEESEARPPDSQAQLRAGSRGHTARQPPCQGQAGLTGLGTNGAEPHTSQDFRLVNDPPLTPLSFGPTLLDALT